MKSPKAWRPPVVCAILFFGTILLFSRALTCNFLDLDDPDYVTQNFHVRAGLTPAGIRWAFQTETAGNWHPLTWLSHMLDWQLFGNNPPGHHATNVFIHAFNALLAFLALRKFTGAFWTSAVAAALFAWHPLRVESVVWIAERKDVLSGFFFMLTLLTYAHYVERLKIKNPKAKIFYGLTLLFFACGLMSKPMLVTLPFVLLLLDFWPLQRFTTSTLQRLILEKILFFTLAAAVCVVTFHAQKNSGAIMETLPVNFRFENATVSIADYLANFFWPFKLAVVYPLPKNFPVAHVLAATFLIFAIMALVIFQRRHRAYLLVGWFWFLGMLVPVIGLVQAGHQAMADRYTYLPSLGLELALLWPLRELILFLECEFFAAVFTVFILAGCATRTWNQEMVWKNSKTLYEHALAVTINNYLAESNLGTTLLNEGNSAEAEEHFRRAIEINSDFATARFKLALALDDSGRTDDALTAYDGLLKIRPRDADAHYNIGVILLNRSQPAAAILHFQAAVESQNNYVSAFVGLGLAQMQMGRTREAVENFQDATKLNPDFPGLREQLAEAQKEQKAAEQIEEKTAK